MLYMEMCARMFRFMCGVWNDDEVDSQKFWEFPEYHRNALVDVQMKCYAWNDGGYSNKQICRSFKNS